MRFFRAGAESTAIKVLTLIDWAVEFFELSHSPVPEIPAFLCIKPDTPINIYTRFCLNTAKSKFSLVSSVADW